MRRVVKTRTALGQYPKSLERKIESEQCYHNSLIVIGTFPYADIEYIEGWIVKPNGEKVLHCWNRYDGKFFDTTYEKFLPEFLTYPAIILVEGTLEDLRADGYYFSDFWKPLSEQVLEEKR